MAAQRSQRIAGTRAYGESTFFSRLGGPGDRRLARDAAVGSGVLVRAVGQLAGLTQVMRYPGTELGSLCGGGTTLSRTNTGASGGTTTMEEDLRHRTVRFTVDGRVRSIAIRWRTGCCSPFPLLERRGSSGSRRVISQTVPPSRRISWLSAIGRPGLSRARGSTNGSKAAAECQIKGHVRSWPEARVSLVEPQGLHRDHCEPMRSNALCNKGEIL